MRFAVVLIAAVLLLSACGTPEPSTGPIRSSDPQAGEEEQPPSAVPQPVVEGQGYPVPQTFDGAYPAFQPPLEAGPAAAIAVTPLPQRPRPIRTAPCPYDPTPTAMSAEHAQTATSYAMTPEPTVDLAAYPEPVPTPECPTPVLNPPGIEAADVVTPTLIVDPSLAANPESSPSTLTPSRWITFFDADNGIGVSDEPGKRTLLRTTDGGLSWQQRNMPPEECVSDGMQFVDPQHGWSAGQAPSDLHGAMQLCRTTDGGGTWTKINRLEQFPYGAVLSFVNPHMGYITGVGGLVKTENGGETFEEVDIVSIPSSLSMMDFVNETEGWGAGDDTLLRTSDGGKTWVEISLGYGVKWVDGLPDGHVWVNAEDCDGRYCQPILLSTDDGGSTWTRYAINNPDFNMGLRDGGLTFIDHLHGLSRSGNKVWSTTDGGRTWTRMR